MLTCADSGHRRDVVVSTAQANGWTSCRGALASPCSCGADAGRWCLRRGRPVVGHLHPSRRPADDGDMLVTIGENISLLDVADLIPSPELVP